MAQATLSCRFAAIHLETPLLGYLRAKCRRFLRRLRSETCLQAQSSVTIFLPVAEGKRLFQQPNRADANGVHPVSLCPRLLVQMIAHGRQLLADLLHMGGVPGLQHQRHHAGAHVGVLVLPGVVDAEDVGAAVGHHL